ncbi:histone acetyltransferase 1 [Paramarasmius palmivorus]|uniref:Histone acetyltransferase type B catalytic subunit n=1 Tax=Paramarasmius palmivorus TaxID=297713 RepID=A0AAW0DCY1_9AGAR
MVRAPEDKKALADDESYENFHPAFTYPIYGEDEKIYGYKDLKIDLRFTSGSLINFLNVKWSEKLASKAQTTVDDVEGTLSEFIPPDYESSEENFSARVEQDAFEFKPMGQMISSYTRPSPRSKGKGKAVSSAVPLDSESEDAVVYEVYHVRGRQILSQFAKLSVQKTTWDTPGFKEYHRRMQLFILLYIEGGSYIKEDEDEWEFVVLYEKRKRLDSPGVVTYHFVGYSSLYKFYYYPEKTRLRLRSIYNYVLAQPHIGELTVEDPAEAFEDLRDKNDLLMLLSNEDFMKEGFGDSTSHGGGRVGKPGRALKGSSAKGKMGPPVERGWAEKWRVKLKIAGRQFSRLVEMIIQMHIDPLDTRAMKAYRLQVKERLYRFNFEALMQIEKQERLEKLEETFQNVKEDYERILGLVRFR